MAKSTWCAINNSPRKSDRPARCFKFKRNANKKCRAIKNRGYRCVVSRNKAWL